MKQLVHIFRDPDSFDAYLQCDEIQQLPATKYGAILAQVYSTPDQPALALGISDAIRRTFPQAVVVGASTVGEIASGKTVTGSTLVILNFFDHTTLRAFISECSAGKEFDTGHSLGQRLHQSADSVKGVLLLATPLSVDMNPLLRGIGKTIGDCPVFGGGAGDYAAMACSWVFLDDQLLDKGVVAVAMSGHNLHLETRTSLGWRALSKEMMITAVDGLKVLTIDNNPALAVYQRYIETHHDSDFTLTASEFPFLIERGNQTLARVPIDADVTGALHFMADISVDDRFRIGYGDPAKMVTHAEELHESMADFAPQGILVFSCGCRRYLMQDDADRETHPFEASAPTAGFYTYGEFHGRGSGLRLLNATLLAVGLREGPPCIHRSIKSQYEFAAPDKTTLQDPYARQHVKVVSSLVRFIGTVTAELEKANQALEILSITDRLTGLFNRARVEKVLDQEVERVHRYGEHLSVIMLDFDHFKQVNDEHGHDTGDAVLVSLARILQNSLRSNDVVGRWGGEEFVIILPQTASTQASEVAEKIRSAVATAEFPVVRHKTASLGVASYQADESVANMLIRADQALYVAKHSGRNRVAVAEHTRT